MALIDPALTDEVSRLTTEKGWRENGAEGSREGPWFAAYIALLHSEASEALEAYRDKIWSDVDQRAIVAGKPIGVGPELADVLIRVIDMADIWGIDLEHELRRVLDYGWTRPYKHGGRQL